MTCTVTGTLRDPQGAVLAATKVSFERTSGVVAQSGAVVVPRLVEVSSDAAGRISVQLVPGDYRASTVGMSKVVRFGVSVPDQASAQLADLIDQQPALTPAVVATVAAARDQAVAAAAAAEAARPNIIVVTTEAAFAAAPSGPNDWVFLANGLASISAV